MKSLFTAYLRAALSVGLPVAASAARPMPHPPLPAPVATATLAATRPASPKRPLVLRASVLPTRPATALPPTIMLRGVVLRASGQPCPGAGVYATQAPHQLVATDAQGVFSLSIPAGPSVLLRAEYFGEGSSRIEVPLPLAGQLRITLGQ